MKECENCGNEHDGKYGSGRFCSVKCSRGFSTKAKRKEINEKVSKKLSLNRHKVKKICPECGNEFKVSYAKRDTTCCSISCASKLRGGWKSVHDKLSKEQWSEINKKSYANGNNFVAGGTAKWLNYKDIRVQGTYELRTCFILDKWKAQGKIKDWEYTNDKISYIGKDKKEHTYLLDFKVFENESFYYIETKGFERPNDSLKWKAVGNAGYKLQVWFDKDIKEIEKEIKT